MSESNSASVPVEENVAPKSFFTRIGGVYTSPRSAFEEIGRAPRVLVPIMVLIVIGFAAGFLILQFIDKEAAVASLLRQMSQQGTAGQQIEQAAPFLAYIVGIQIVMAFVVGALIYALITAGYAKLFSVISGAESRFKALFSATLYAAIAILSIQYFLMVLVVYLKRPFQADLTTLSYVLASNLNGLLSRFFGENVLPKYLMALATYIEFFAIWMIVLLAIGYSAVSKKLKTSTAATWLGMAYGAIAFIGAIFLAGRI